jgi:hypothetical protein
MKKRAFPKQQQPLDDAHRWYTEANSRSSKDADSNWD